MASFFWQRAPSRRTCFYKVAYVCKGKKQGKPCFKERCRFFFGCFKEAMMLYVGRGCGVLLTTHMCMWMYENVEQSALTYAQCAASATLEKRTIFATLVYERGREDEADSSSSHVHYPCPTHLTTVRRSAVSSGRRAAFVRWMIKNASTDSAESAQF